jgi:hypothetical protein
VGIAAPHCQHWSNGPSMRSPQPRQTQCRQGGRRSCASSVRASSMRASSWIQISGDAAGEGALHAGVETGLPEHVAPQ